jgi:hypothetical protein
MSEAQKAKLQAVLAQSQAEDSGDDSADDDWDDIGAPAEGNPRDMVRYDWDDAARWWRAIRGIW